MVHVDKSTAVAGRPRGSVGAGRRLLRRPVGSHGGAAVLPRPSGRVGPTLGGVRRAVTGSLHGLTARSWKSSRIRFGGRRICFLVPLPHG